MIPISFRPLMTGLLLPAAFLAGCSDAPVNPSSPCTSATASQATPTPLMPRKGVVKLRAGDRRRFDEATVRLALVSLDEAKGEAVVRLIQKGKPDESRLVRTAINETALRGWPIPSFDSCAIKGGKVNLFRNYGWGETESPISVTDPKASAPAITSWGTCIGTETITLSPRESWAADGLSGELRVDSVDAAAGTAKLRFIYDGGRSDRTFTLRRGYRLDSHGLDLGLRAIGSDGELTVERF